MKVGKFYLRGRFRGNIFDQFRGSAEQECSKDQELIISVKTSGNMYLYIRTYKNHQSITQKHPSMFSNSKRKNR